MQSATLTNAFPLRRRLQPYQARAVLVLRVFLRVLVLMPRALVAFRLEWLRWLRAELNPMHPGLNEVMRDIRAIETRYGFGTESPAPIVAVRSAWVSFWRWC